MRPRPHQALLLLSSVYKGKNQGLGARIFCASLLWCGMASEAMAKAGMPQLDPSSYPSQLLWLALTFSVTYIIIDKLALPQIQNILGRRDEMVRTHVEQASLLRDQAEDMKIAYEEALKQADDKAQALLLETMNEIRQNHRDEMTALTASLQQRLDAFEVDLTKKQEKVIKSLEPELDKMADDAVMAILGQKTSKQRKAS